MTDFTKQLESGIEVNGVYQRVIPVICYIDIPIQMVIKKLELYPFQRFFVPFYLIFL